MVGGVCWPPVLNEMGSMLRISTLRQCEGTALATMPDVVLMDAIWTTGDALGSCSRMTSDPGLL